MHQFTLPKLTTASIILLSLFLTLGLRNTVIAEIPGSRGLLSCESARNLKLKLYKAKGGSQKKVSKEQALKMLSRFSKTLKRAERDSQDFLLFMESENLDKTGQALSLLLSERAIIRFNKVSGGLKVSQVPSASNLSIDLSGSEVYEAISQSLLEIPAMKDAIRSGKKQVRQCKGCFSRTLRSESSKRRKKNKCTRCKEREYPASLIFRSGNYGTCACYNVVFVQWDERLTRKASAVSAVIDWTGGGELERTTTVAEPYDNRFSLGDGEPTLSVDTGQNWIQVLESYVVDFNVERCAPDCQPGLSSLMTFAENPRIRTSCD